MPSDTIVYRARVFDLHEVVADDGSVKAYVDHPGSIGVVPLLERDGRLHVILVSQTRLALGERLLEIPAGTLEQGEDAASTAHREIREETGYACARLEPLGVVYLAPGYSNERMSLFVASGLTPSSAQADADEDIELEILPLSDAIARARQGDFHDLKTIAALLLVEAWQDRPRVP